METVLLALGRGKFAIIDAEDAVRVVGLRWTAKKKTGRDIWYAYGYAWRPGDEHPSKMALHRLILRAEETQGIDHINGDGLDCRKANLRFATAAQNGCNRSAPRSNTTGFKGVFSDHRGERVRWRAKIQCASKQYALGSFDTPEEAARAYDRAAREMHGEFARLNFPD